MASTISAGTTTTTALVYTADTSGVLQLQTNGTTTAVTIDTSQNVGIGNSSPSYRLDTWTAATSTTVGANTAGSFSSNGNGYDVNIRMGDNVNASTRLGYISGSMYFWTNAAERARIDTSGNWLVGTTNTSNSAGVGLKYLYNFSGAYQLALVTPSSTSSTTSIGIYSTGASANRFYVDDGGTIHATSTSITAISDASLKTNIKPLETGLAEINKLQPRRFDWLDQTKNEGTNIAGFISQEVQEVLPDLTPAFKYNDTETKLGLKMGDMIPTMVKAIQELSAKVTALQETVTALQAKVGT